MPLLRDLAHARSGDKSGTVNIGVIVVNAADFDRVGRSLTPDRIRAAVECGPEQPVEVYPLPKLGAFNVVLPDVLGGAPPYTLSYDVFGHHYAARLLRLEVVDE